ncbi:hypothetical protein B0J18DRAFT_188861 [Chaetomium sp. MPI-SDFR-AT-0129]|nr:hypothetical protein B0J18DRAFT_188861 [Chaetomium sp. MPI-SDFR-AT-0129]
MRCTKTGRRCDGYLDAKTMSQRRRRSAVHMISSVGEPRAPPSLFYDWAAADERRAFHFFQHITAPCLSGDLDGAFWRVLVLQICQSEPAVRHAVLAVSSLHEGMVQATGTSHVNVNVKTNSEERSSFALYQYNRAIAFLLDQMRTVDAKPLVPLLTCVLFVCIELMQSKDRESLLHLDQGRQILSQLGRKGTAAPSPEINLIKQHLVPMYTRLSLTSLMFGGEPVEIPEPLKTLTELPMVFETIDEVRYALYDFMDECLRFAKKTRLAKLSSIPSDTMRAYETEQEALLRKLAKFNVAFSMYRSTKSRASLTGSLSLIQIHVHTTYIWISTALSQNETVFDDYVDTFSAIIPLATEFIASLSRPSATPEHQLTGGSPGTDTRRFSSLFTFEMSIIAPLYFVGAKCRHPIIRRAALDLLRRNPSRRENLWRANVMADIAEKTMRLEEKHLRPDSQPHSRRSSPPELSGLFLGSSGLGEDTWATEMSDSFPVAFGPGNPGPPAAGMSRPVFESYEVSQPTVTTSSCSSSSLTGSAEMGSIDDLTAHMPIDPTLFLDPTEDTAGHPYSAAPSVTSSLEDFTGSATSTPYVGATSAAADAPADLWGNPVSLPNSQQPPDISISVEAGSMPLSDTSPYLTALPFQQQHSQSQSHSQSHSRTHSRSHSQQPSRSRGSSFATPDGSPNQPVMGTDVAGSMSMTAMFGTHSSSITAKPPPHHHQSRYSGGLRVGQLSPATGRRSADAPYDVPEHFRVHESIIGPDKEDGTNWVMLFRKLGGLNAEWDVLTEYMAVA